MSENKCDIGIVTAMPIEMRKFTQHITQQQAVKKDGIDYQVGMLGNKNIAFIVCGIGQINTAIKTTGLITHFNPSYMFFSGIAGAINKQLDIGSIVIPETVFLAESLSFMQYDGYRECQFGKLPPLKHLPDANLLAQAKTVANNFDTQVTFGVITSSDYFPIPTYLPTQFEEKTIDAIDMESAAFSQTCALFNKPFLIARGLSNYTGNDIVSFDSLKPAVVEQSADAAAQLVIDLIKTIK